MRTKAARVSASCSVIGTWLSYYDGVTHTDSGAVEIDHTVALAEAWDSGARHWSPERRRAFGNDVDLPAALGFLWIGGVGTALAYWCWFRGLTLMTAGAVSLVGLVNPVVGTLLDVGTGTPLAVASTLNAQQPFGGDVITRISATMMDPEALGRLQEAAGRTLSSLASQVCREAGVDPAEVTIQNLQHADGRTALDTGQVDAWSGLDPIMAAAEAESGDKIIYENVDFNSYGFLNATEEFLTTSPDLAESVVNAYERARAWAQENPEETAAIRAETAGIAPEVAQATLARTTLDVDPVPGAAQEAVLEEIGPIFVANGDVADQAQIDAALESLFEPTYAEAADPEAIAVAAG